LETASAKGIYADLVLGSDEQEMRKTPTPEQKAQNKLGDPVLDSNGKEVKMYRPNIKSVLSRAEKPSANAGM